MFISSYEELRAKLIEDEVISTLIQLEYSGFEGATVPICTFTLASGHIPRYEASYVKLSKFKGASNQAPRTLEAIKNRSCGWFYNAKPDDFAFEAVRTMGDKQVRRVPIVNDEGVLEGIVSMADVALEMEDEKEIAETLEEISSGAAFWNKS